MGIRTLQVILKDTVEGGPGVFFSGTNVTGEVHISVDGDSQTAKGIEIANHINARNYPQQNELFFAGVRLECVGKAKVLWTEPRHKQTNVYKNKVSNEMIHNS